MYQKKIIAGQTRKSAVSQVLLGRFQCHKKRQANIYVILLKQFLMIYENNYLQDDSIWYRQKTLRQASWAL